MNDLDRQIRSSTAFAISFGKKKNLSVEQSEDLAQRYVIKKYVDKTGQSIEQCYTDFLRSEYGSYRTKNGLLKSAQRHRSEDHCQDQFYDPIDDLEKREGYQKIKRLLALLTNQEHYIFTRMIRGHSQREIGIDLNLSEARISQLKTVIADKLAVADLDKKICVDWITL